jgi:hypothetical protein
MSQEKELLKALDSSALIAGWAAQIMANSDFEPKNQNIMRVAEAISTFQEISQLIYKKCPELKPAKIRAKSKETKSIVYNADNPVPNVIREWMDVSEAIEMLKMFQETGLNQSLKTLSIRELPAMNELRIALEKRFEKDLSNRE